MWWEDRHQALLWGYSVKERDLNLLDECKRFINLTLETNCCFRNEKIISHWHVGSLLRTKRRNVVLSNDPTSHREIIIAPFLEWRIRSMISFLKTPKIAAWFISNELSLLVLDESSSRSTNSVLEKHYHALVSGSLDYNCRWFLSGFVWTGRVYHITMSNILVGLSFWDGCCVYQLSSVFQDMPYIDI